MRQKQITEWLRTQALVFAKPWEEATPMTLLVARLRALIAGSVMAVDQMMTRNISSC